MVSIRDQANMINLKETIKNERFKISLELQFFAF